MQKPAASFLIPSPWQGGGRLLDRNWRKSPACPRSRPPCPPYSPPGSFSSGSAIALHSNGSGEFVFHTVNNRGGGGAALPQHLIGVGVDMPSNGRHDKRYFEESSPTHPVRCFPTTMPCLCRQRSASYAQEITKIGCMVGQPASPVKGGSLSESLCRAVRQIRGVYVRHCATASYSRCR